MNDSDKQMVIDRYNKRLEQFGVSIDALASGTEERRSMRFDILTQIGVTAGDSILDLGCGFGDYLLYCQKRNLCIDYMGIDINSHLIEEARKRFPGVPFEVNDIQTDILAKVDYVISTSCFNLEFENQDNYEFIEEIMAKSYSIARKGVAIDFLTEYVDFHGVKEAFYYSPEKIFSIAKKITKRVCLRHDYPLFEFCIYLYPDFTGWQSK